MSTAPADRSSVTIWIGWPVLALLGAISVLKGLRMPSRWAVTHYLFTYQLGFMKRGLWGELLWLALGVRTSNYFVLAAVGVAVLAAWLVVFVRICRQVPASQDRVPLLILVLASPALAFFAHLAGYLEQIDYLVLLAIVLAARRRSSGVLLALAFAAAAILPLVHEASIFWVAGLSMLAILASRGDGLRDLRTRTRAIALLAVVWIASTMAVLTLGRMTPERAAALRDDRVGFFQLRPRIDAFDALATSLGADWSEMRARWARADVEIDMLLSIAVFAPAALGLGAIAVRRARAIDPTVRAQRAAVALTVVAIAAPLALNIMGRDEHRWNGLAALNAGLAALLLVSTTAEPAADAARASRAPRHLAMVLAIGIWSITADPAFFDFYTPSHPPFADHVNFLIDAVRAPGATMWQPDPGR
jgi:hypothetical protein